MNTKSIRYVKVQFTAYIPIHCIHGQEAKVVLNNIPEILKYAYFDEVENISSEEFDANNIDFDPEDLPFTVDGCSNYTIAQLINME